MHCPMNIKLFSKPLKYVNERSSYIPPTLSTKYTVLVALPNNLLAKFIVYYGTVQETQHLTLCRRVVL